MTETNSIPFNFSYFALKLLGKQMYTNNWSAISELIANGLDAGATNVKLYIESIDKENSKLEILDNGSGMDYVDLATKYALIGRNRRISNGEFSEKTKGRKGIGKLATLFLSKKYYIVSKKNGIETAWMLDSTNASESDVPELIRVTIDDVCIENKEIWDSFESGTLIKSVGVNLVGFAEGKLDSLKMTLANYYLLNNIGAVIEVAYKTKPTQKVEFSKVSKVIGFKNLYAYFQTSYGIIKSELLNNSVKINSDLEQVTNKLRKVIKLSPSDITRISLKGKRNFVTINGNYKEFEYELTGWIGIHSTINMLEAVGNTGEDPGNRFIRNSVYKANQLRLYVRDKLAVSDFMPQLNNTQAFSNYIEGEISFDILDNDDLEDISTSNREGLSGNDERITLLIELLKPIVNKLISERVNIGSIVRKEVEKIRHEEKEQAERKKRLAEEKKKVAEKQRDEAELAKRLAETKQKEAERARDTAEEENKRKDVLIESNNSAQQNLLAHELTGIYKNIDSVNKKLAVDFKLTDEFERVSKYVVSLKKSSGKLYTIKNQILKLNTPEVKGKKYIDVKKYIKSYLDSLSYKDFEILVDFSANSHMSRVHIFDLGMILDNFIINAMDQLADRIIFKFEDEENKLIISSNKPLSPEIVDKDDIFRLGFTTKENGTGVGMYIIKQTCKKFKWEIKVASNVEETSFIIDLGDN
ncbi:ATP-binding protein [Streptococcus salivarius]|uniref:sensor histidine kinase n=1 Tax=Streptococcus salivarius TaxID=1304 RepID=UPI00397B2C31